MSKNFEITFSDPKCNHHDHCGCRVTVTGISPSTKDMIWSGSGGSLDEQYLEAGNYINRVQASRGPDGQVHIDEEVEFFKSHIKRDSTVKLIPPPVSEPMSWPTNVELFDLHPQVQVALKRADYRYFRHTYPDWDISWKCLEKYVWPNPAPSKKVPSLFYLALRYQSSVHWVCGKTNGRPHVLSAMSRLFPRKAAKAVLAVSRESVGGRPKDPMNHIQSALDHFYRLAKIDLRHKTKVKLSFKMLENMYLGASNGITTGKKRTIPASPELPIPVQVSSKGKKIDTFEQDLNAILNYLRTGIEPPVFWSSPLKDENFFSFVKQFDDAAYERWQNKVRVFFIPSGIYVLLEKLTCTLRHLRERGHLIRVGHKNSHGGGDTLANCLGVTEETCFDPDLVEGDCEHFDQSVLECWVNLYFSTMTVHYDRSSPDFPIFEMIIKFLLRNMIVRITKLFGDVWGLVKGGVPSGAFNTSHMDSWIMAMYIILFCVFQVNTAPLDVREDLEEFFITIIRIIVYGDDHLYRKGKGPLSSYFCGTAFAHFMKTYFNVNVRDLRDGVSFASKEFRGWLIHSGATFLKHQHVLNPYRKVYPDQPTFIPYRESREYLIRCIYGRITKPRDVIDTLLSILGHAYGTYASNRDAYDRLLFLYHELLVEIGDISNLKERLLERIGHDELKKIRQLGLSGEELVSGFPSWQVLIDKNKKDPVYQDNTKIPFDFGCEVSGPDDIF
jgi:hypothetical protein